MEYLCFSSLQKTQGNERSSVRVARLSKWHRKSEEKSFGKNIVEKWEKLSLTWVSSPIRIVPTPIRIVPTDLIEPIPKCSNIELIFYRSSCSAWLGIFLERIQLTIVMMPTRPCFELTTMYEQVPSTYRFWSDGRAAIGGRGLRRRRRQRRFLDTGLPQTVLPFLLDNTPVVAVHGMFPCRVAALHVEIINLSGRLILAKNNENRTRSRKINKHSCTVWSVHYA